MLAEHDDREWDATAEQWQAAFEAFEKSYQESVREAEADRLAELTEEDEEDDHD